MVKSYTTEAIIINRFNYSEADKVLTLFTKDHGKLTAIAKGLRKPQSKRKGHLELFNHIRCQLITSHTWDILTEVETVHYFTPLTTNPQLETGNGKLETISAAYRFAELIDRLLPSHEPHPDIFDLLSKTFLALGPHPYPLLQGEGIPSPYRRRTQDEVTNQSDSYLNSVDKYFKHRLIRSLGFWPSDRTVPTDIDAFIDSLLERPLKTTFSLLTIQNKFDFQPDSS